MKKIRKNQNRKLVIYASEKDADNLENEVIAIPLCNEHKGFGMEKTDERKLMTMHYECKKCGRIKDRQAKSIWKIWDQMVNQMY
jgi:hypothetical protein